jgi:hypothetical protein
MMKGLFYTGWFSIGMVCLGLLLAGAPGGPAQAGTHADVPLKNEIGETITPARNRTDPYSTRQTCGGCHGYATITSGYHFQQGFDEMSDRYNSRQPWILSPGMYGKWQPAAAAGRLARKKNDHARQIDLSTYDWIGGGKLDAKGRVKAAACGWCHPGGGPLEYGRGADGRRDLSMNHIQAEGQSRSPDDGDYSSHATTDGRSRFRQSGVVEADCLICHMPGYRMNDRNRQLSARNYRWAATAGAGLGSISGAVFTYADPDAGPDHADFSAGAWNVAKRPVVAYDWKNTRLFTQDGRLRGGVISKSVGSANCRQCHAAADAKNTGSIHDARFDAHLAAGFQCTDCHGLVGANAAERLRHQIAKGWSPHNTVRDDLNGAGMKTCVTCHIEGGYAAARKGMPAAAKNPAAVHAEKFSGATFHTFIVQCAGCHAVAQPARGLYLLDMSTGGEVGYTADALARVVREEDYAAAASQPWKPWMVRTRTGKDRQERYAPYAPKVFQWFGEKTAGAEIRPIALREVSRAVRAVGGVAAIDVKGADGGAVRQPSVLSDGDIRRMIAALTRQGFRNVVYVSDRVYAVEKGTLVATDRPAMAHEKPYTVEHGMAPVAQRTAYGAKGNPDGCMNCHADDAAFFAKLKIKNMRGFLKDDYPVVREPHAGPQMLDWGMSLVPAFE